jgi:hypothetical protein
MNTGGLVFLRSQIKKSTTMKSIINQHYRAYVLPSHLNDPMLPSRKRSVTTPSPVAKNKKPPGLTRAVLCALAEAEIIKSTINKS